MDKIIEGNGVSVTNGGKNMLTTIIEVLLVVIVAGAAAFAIYLEYRPEDKNQKPWEPESGEEESGNEKHGGDHRHKAGGHQ